MASTTYTWTTPTISGGTLAAVNNAIKFESAYNFPKDGNPSTYSSPTPSGNTIETLYINEEQTHALYPRTKVDAVSNDTDILPRILENKKLRCEILWTHYIYYSYGSTTLTFTGYKQELLSKAKFLIVDFRCTGSDTYDAHTTYVCPVNGKGQVCFGVWWGGGSNVITARHIVADNTKIFIGAGYRMDSYGNLNISDNNSMIPACIWVVY